MTRALFVLTPAESKRLIGKAVAAMAEVKYAFRHSNILVSHGITNIYVLEELLGKQRLCEILDPATFVTGLVKRSTLCSTAAKKKTPIVLLKKGVITPPAPTMSEMLRDFDSKSVIIKGANAVDAEGDAGVFVANPEGGTIGWAIGTILSRGICFITPVGLEKMVPSVKKAVSLCGQDTIDYVQGMKVGMIPMNKAKVITEITAIKILTGVDAFHVASGGINGSEGAVILVAEGESKAMNKTIKLIESIKGEVSLQFQLDVCETCPAAPQKPGARRSGTSKGNCRYRGKKAKDLPAYMRET